MKVQYRDREVADFQGHYKITDGVGKEEEVAGREDEMERTYFVVNGVVYWSRADALAARQN